MHCCLPKEYRLFSYFWDHRRHHSFRASDRKRRQQQQHHYHNWSINDFEMGKTLRKHKYGELNLMRTIGEKFIVAINVLSMEKIVEAEAVWLMKREIDVQTLFRLDRHPNIYGLYTWFYGADARHFYLFTEYIASGGSDLLTYIQTEKGGKLDESEVARIVNDLVSALLYLRGKNVLYHSLQIDNLRIGLLEGKVKIADFGLMSGFSVYYHPMLTANEVSFFAAKHC